MDYSNVKFLGMEIDSGYKGFREFKEQMLKFGIDVDELIDEARNRAPQRRLVTIEDVGNMAVGLASDQMKSVTGNIAYVDAGYHVMS